MTTKPHQPASGRPPDAQKQRGDRSRRACDAGGERTLSSHPARRRGKIFTPNFWVAVLGLSVAGLAAAPCRPVPLALLNVTPSEPLGVYLRDNQAPKVGSVVAFKPSGAARTYEDRRGGRLDTFLKTIVAVAGDRVCVRNHALKVNDALKGLVAVHDRFGAPLPQWRGCRRLSSGELFVFSNRASNSFDSRYFGPVQATAVVGVFHHASFFSAATR